MTSNLCPYCKQRMLVHHGERFTVQESDILQMIEGVTKGRGGISMDELVNCFFSETSRKAAVQRITSVVWSINEKLAATDFRIKGPGQGNKEGFYKFIDTSRKNK